MAYLRSALLLLLCAATQVTAQDDAVCTLEDAEAEFCPHFEFDGDGNLCPYGYWQDPDTLCPNATHVRSEGCPEGAGIHAGLCEVCVFDFLGALESSGGDPNSNAAWNAAMAQCLAPAVPAGADLCPAGTELAADVLTPVVG
eukprot:SAG31_NODE_6074_length_2181_cov_1.853987_1_plen_141_part_01